MTLETIMSYLNSKNYIYVDPKQGHVQGQANGLTYPELTLPKLLPRHINNPSHTPGGLTYPKLTEPIFFPLTLAEDRVFMVWNIP